MRIRDWSTGVCSSDRGQQHGEGVVADQRLGAAHGMAKPERLHLAGIRDLAGRRHPAVDQVEQVALVAFAQHVFQLVGAVELIFDRLLAARSEEHTSELQPPIRISYAVFCLNKKKTQKHTTTTR